MSRIRLDMSARDIVIEMCDGNPGALNVLMALLTKGAEIDPDALMGPIAVVLSLDQHEIYGSHVWVLFKDVCGGDLVKLVACLRAVQLGFLRDEDLKAAVVRGETREPSGIDFADVLSKVRARLPRFAPASPAEGEASS